MARIAVILLKLQPDCVIYFIMIEKDTSDDFIKTVTLPYFDDTDTSDDFIKTVTLQMTLPEL